MWKFAGSLVIAGITYYLQRGEESTAPSPVLHHSPTKEIQMSLTKMWKFVGSLAVAGIASFSHEKKNPPRQGLFHRPKARTRDYNPKMWKFVGTLAVAGIAYYYYQRRRGKESIAPRPPPSTQSSDKRPLPSENSRRKPTEVSRSSSSPFLSFLSLTLSALTSVVQLTSLPQIHLPALEIHNPKMWKFAGSLVIAGITYYLQRGEESTAPSPVLHHSPTKEIQMSLTKMWKFVGSLAVAGIASFSHEKKNPPRQGLFHRPKAQTRDYNPKMWKFVAGITYYLQRGEESTAPSPVLHHSPTKEIQMSLTKMWKFVGSLAVAGIASFSHEKENPPRQGLSHRPKARTRDYNPKMWKFVGTLAVAGIAYYYYQRRRGKESIAPRPPPSTQSSDKRPSPSENSRRKPTEVSRSSSSPFLSSSEPSPSSHVSRGIPSPVENYRRIPTEVSKVSSPLLPTPSPKAFRAPTSSPSKKVELPRYEIPEHLKEEIKQDIVPSVLKRPSPSPEVLSSPLSPSLSSTPSLSSSEQKSPSDYLAVPLQENLERFPEKSTPKDKGPSPSENSRRTPTEVSKVSSTPSLSSSEQKSPSYYLAVPLQETLDRFPVKSTPKVSSPQSPSPSPPPSPPSLRRRRRRRRRSTVAFRAPTSSPSKKVELPRYEIPEHLKEEIKQDIVPSVLKRPLHPLNYADYFAVLLYAEDYYCEKWSEYLLSDATLKLRSKESFSKVPNLTGTKKDNKNRMGKDFVEIEIDSVPERRPYLRSRDYVRLQPSGGKVEPFQGVLFRVVNSTTVLAEFEDDFHRQHSPSKKYNVSFSFNRVCLKRSHQAIVAAMDPLLSSILFPDPSSRIDCMNSAFNMFSAARGTEYGPFQVTSRILNLKDPVPYLIEGPLSEAGPLSEESPESLSSTGTVIKETIIQICRTSPHCRILVCAPRNRTCDALTRSLLEDIPNSEIFRANAAFRDYDLVPDDIIAQCSYEDECFTCPSFSELQEFKIITSTFISTFRLYAARIAAGHFTHIFLVDASSTTEPEAVVALANLVSKKTVIVVTGSSKDIPAWVRSDIARRNGLKRSFFQRLLERNPYSTNDPRFISHVTW